MKAKNLLGVPIYNKSVTDVTKVSVIESSTHALGSMTPSDLASLLLGLQIPVDDVDTKLIGWRYVTGESAHNPFTTQGIIFNVAINQYDGFQFHILTNGSFYVRALKGGNWQTRTQVNLTVV